MPLLGVRGPVLRMCRLTGVPSGGPPAVIESAPPPLLSENLDPVSALELYPPCTHPCTVCRSWADRPGSPPHCPDTGSKAGMSGHGCSPPKRCRPQVLRFLVLRGAKTFCLGHFLFHRVIRGVISLNLSRLPPSLTILARFTLGVLPAALGNHAESHGAKPAALPREGEAIAGADVRWGRLRGHANTGRHDTCHSLSFYTCVIVHTALCKCLWQ